MCAQWRAIEDYEAMRKDRAPLPYLQEALTISRFEPGMYEVIETYPRGDKGSSRTSIAHFTVAGFTNGRLFGMALSPFAATYRPIEATFQYRDAVSKDRECCVALAGLEVSPPLNGTLRSPSHPPRPWAA
jgi:hypothetical protein